jgi:S-adenosylmethionine:tRNA ribosyltransferase-isomerase
MTHIRTDDFDYRLPDDLIAYTPADDRETSRLLVLDRARGSALHTTFARLAEHLDPGDLVVVNDTKVIRARLLGKKRGTGGRVELLLVRELGPGRWEALVSPSRRLHAGTEIELEGGSTCRVVERMEGARRLVAFPSEDVLALLDEIGHVPLPPYIKRPDEDFDIERYQTVYASSEGSIAAPTAGLHFSEALLENLKGAGVKLASLTLHVGPGTFLAVTVDDPHDHDLDPEYFEIGQACCDAVDVARSSGRRVIAVGTTTVRALETLADRAAGGALSPQKGWTHKMILPPYEFRLVDAMVTNFHLPRSTLLMLVCAFAGRDLILDAYGQAISRRYRFFSYGDAMLIV